MVLEVRGRARIVIALAQLAAPPSRTVAGDGRRRLYLDAQRKHSIYSFAVRSGLRWHT